jgi:hypothetical protein
VNNTDRNGKVHPNSQQFLNRKQFLKASIISILGTTFFSSVSMISPFSKSKLLLAQPNVAIEVSSATVKVGRQATLSFYIAPKVNISNIIASIVSLPQQLVLIQQTAQIDLIQNGESRILTIPVGSSAQTPAGSYRVLWEVTFVYNGDGYIATGEVFINLSTSDSGDSSSGGCFIATAAYGSSQTAQIEILRDVRDTALLPSKIGQRLVKSYYKNSPPIAAYLTQHETMRTVVRNVFIKPIIYLVHSISFIWK